MKTITYTLPSYWACALINNDWSGLELDGLDAAQELRDWLRDNNQSRHNCLTCSDEAYISREYKGLLCDVLDYTFVVPEDVKEYTTIRTVCGRGRITYHKDWSPSQPWVSYWDGTAGRHFKNASDADNYFKDRFKTCLKQG